MGAMVNAAQPVASAAVMSEPNCMTRLLNWRPSISSITLSTESTSVSFNPVRCVRNPSVTSSKPCVR